MPPDSLRCTANSIGDHKDPSQNSRKLIISAMAERGAQGAGLAAGGGINYDFFIKLLVIGDSGVGKSCLLLRFCDDSFTPSFITTIGLDLKVRTVDIDGKRVKLQIWDTAGQERFRAITTAYYRSAMGILVVYDVTDERSFNNVRNWVRNTEQFAAEDVVRILVGNKCDMADKRAVPRERAEALAAEYGMAFVETSAKAGIRVDEAFMRIAREIKQRIVEARQAEAAERTGVSLEGGADTWLGRMQSSCCGGAPASAPSSKAPES